MLKVFKLDNKLSMEINLVPLLHDFWETFFFPQNWTSVDRLNKTSRTWIDHLGRAENPGRFFVSVVEKIQVSLAA